MVISAEKLAFSIWKLVLKAIFGTICQDNFLKRDTNFVKKITVV